MEMRRASSLPPLRRSIPNLDENISGSTLPQTGESGETCDAVRRGLGVGLWMAKDEVKIDCTGVSRMAMHGVRVLLARMSSLFLQ